MRRLFLAAIVAAAAIGLGAGGQAPPPRRVSFTAEQKVDLDRISGYLNGIRTMKGTFTQLDGNGGMARGEFLLQKPGKIRFEYAPPAQLLVVADGYSVTVQNKKLNTTDRYPLLNSPLEFVLSNNLNLKFNPLILGVDHQNGSLVLRARSAQNRMTGNITMVFSDPNLVLQQWTIIDAQGQQTTVSLSDMQTGVPIDGSSFVLTAASKN